MPFCPKCGQVLYDGGDDALKCINAHYFFAYIPKPEPPPLREPVIRKDTGRPMKQGEWKDRIAELKGDMMDANEAGAILKVTPARVRQMAVLGEIGVTEKYYGAKKLLFFDPADLEAHRGRGDL